MTVAEYVAKWIASINPRVYAVCGAGAMHLNDAICHHPGLEVMAMHHEQAATFAAEADARVSGRPGIVLVTAGPGGTNAVTGVACAYVDSVPMIIIAGQVTTQTLKSRPLRQLGLNEIDGTSIVAPITKRAITLTDPKSVPHDLAVMHHMAVKERPGPVWIEIPLDIQAAEIGEQDIVTLADVGRWSYPSERLVERCAEWLLASKRPVLIVGNGARGSNLQEFLEKISIPVVSSWNGSDLLDSKDPCYIGRIGIFGDRASNYAVQNADLVICVGTRLSVAQIGHASQLFAANAKKVVIDIDEAEFNKPTVKPDLAIQCDAKLFFDALAMRSVFSSDWRLWRSLLIKKKHDLPTMQPEYRSEDHGVNVYYFVEELQKHLKDDAVVVTDVGVAFICTMQTLKLNGKQRLFHSSGVSPMGWGFPASIGAYRAGHRQTICLTGDGGMMLNLQELQTIIHYRLPIAIFVFANNGYATIRYMQDNHFKRHSISSPDTGLSCPDFDEVAKAFGIPAFSLFSNDEARDWMEYVTTRKHPILCVVHVSPNQVISPRVQTKTANGKFIPTPLDEMTVA